MDQVWFLAGLGLVGLTTVALARWARVPLGWLPLWAVGRAAVQLGCVALILSGVLAAPWTVVLFVLLMFTTASWTAGRRLRELRGGYAYALLGVAAGATAGLLPAFGLHLVDLNARQFIAVAGIVMGNSMSAATLSGRNFLHNAAIRKDEVEGWLALGARPSQAYADIGRHATREALLPTLDQTKSTGLVTLPGAFVGALFGGAAPLDAAKFQLVVLACVALAMLTCGIIVTRLAGRLPFIVVRSGEH